MNDPDLDIFKRYALHKFLQSFAFSLLIAFGALFIYAKTGSIGIALAGAFFEILGDLIIRSALVEWWWNTLLGRRQIFAMFVGMVITALTSFGIFLVNPSQTFGVGLLLILSAVSSFGTSIYAMPSNAVFYRTIGLSQRPGRYASLIKLASIGGAMFAAVISLVLNAHSHFLALLPCVALVVMLSLIPLIGLRLPKEKPVIWKRSLRRLSVRTLLANFAGDSRLQSTGVPLILVLLSGSLGESVFVTAAVLLVAAGLAYLAGKLKDYGRSSLFFVALIGLGGVWLAYAIIASPLWFIVVGSLQYILSTILDIGVDARLSREVANTGHFIEGAIATELVQALGTLTGTMILIVAYWLTGTLPQAILVLGIVFVIPRGLYALGALDEPKLP
jgi:MFS family permease